MREPRKPRAVRVEDSLWTAALEASNRKGEPLSEAIRRFLVGYIKR